MCRRLRRRFADWLNNSLTFTATLHASLNPSVDNRKPKLSYLERGSSPSSIFKLAYLTRPLQSTTWSMSTRQATDCAIDRSASHTRVAARTQDFSRLCECRWDGFCNMSGGKSFQVLSMLKMCEIAPAKKMTSGVSAKKS